MKKKAIEHYMKIFTSSVKPEPVKAKIGLQRVYVYTNIPTNGFLRVYDCIDDKIIDYPDTFVGSVEYFPGEWSEEECKDENV